MISGFTLQACDKRPVGRGVVALRGHVSRSTNRAVGRSQAAVDDLGVEKGLYVINDPVGAQ